MGVGVERVQYDKMFIDESRWSLYGYSLHLFFNFFISVNEYLQNKNLEEMGKQIPKEVYSPS